MAALVCCVLYLASALVLRDHVFVYVLAGGVAMTGLLMLAHADRFWEIASPAAMLVVLGLISIHVERAFPEIEGPFSRRRFGMAFFRSGQVLSGRGVALGAGGAVGRRLALSAAVRAALPAMARRPAGHRRRAMGPVPRPGLGPGRNLRLFLFRHRGAARRLLRLSGGVHAPLGGNAGDRTVGDRTK